MSCKVIQSNSWHLDGGVMFGNAPKALWNRWVECDDQNRIVMASNCGLVQHDGLTVLIDTGISPFMEPKLNERYAIEGDKNELLENLEKAGVAEADVDYVILGHIHFDHIGGLMPAWPGLNDANAQPNFPNAKYLLNQRQFERALEPHPRDRASFFSDIIRKINDTGRLTLLADGENVPELVSFITLEVSDGHTPGMMMPLVKTDDETFFFPGDMISGTPWLHIPIVTGLDRTPEDLIYEKKAYLERAVAEDWILVFDHDATTSSSKVRFDDEKKRYLAID